MNLLSQELEVGKCGEYFAIFSLMKQGFTAYLSDQGLPYDLVVDVNGVLLRGQVKSTIELRSYGKSKNVYRFGTRSAKKSLRKANVKSCDFYAFVAIEDQKIAFMSNAELESKANPGFIKQTIEFRSIDVRYLERVYPTGRKTKYPSAMCLEDFGDFKRVAEKITLKTQGEAA